MGRSRSSGHSHTWSNYSGYSDKPHNSSRWYFWSKPAGNSYNGAYVDPDQPSSAPQNQCENMTQSRCESHLRIYEELLLRFGRGSLELITARFLLIGKCGAYFDLDKPSSVPKERRYRPTKFQCGLHLQKFEELVQKFGRDSLAATTNRELLIEKCGLGSDFEKPSCRSSDA